MQKWLGRDTERAQNIRNLCRHCLTQNEFIQKSSRTQRLYAEIAYKRHRESPENKESMQKLPKTEGTYTEIPQKRRNLYTNGLEETQREPRA